MPSKFRIVVFHATADGTKPVLEWLRHLNDQQAKSVALGLKFFEDYPNPIVPKKYLEKVTAHLWEIKVHHGRDQFRVLAFMGAHGKIVAVHGFAKKTMELKKRDLETAEERRLDHIRKTPRQREP